MQTDLNELAMRAKLDDRLLEQLIRENERAILRTASLTSRKFVTKSDDEWSVALYAFSRAVGTYEPEKGEFLPYAKVLIRRDLIDHFRREARHGAEISTEPELLAEAIGSGTQAPENSLAEEIAAANEMLSAYGFSFFDLTACSPQQEKTRQQCAAAVRYLLAHPAALEGMKESRRMPLAALRDGVPLPEKLLDRHRRYIIAAALILSGEYPHLAEYLKSIRKEGPA